MKMKETIVQQCLEILKKEDIKNELKILFKPVMDIIPYIYITLILVF